MDELNQAVRGIKPSKRPHEAQGNVATGTKLAKQIKSPDVGLALYTKAGARRYHQTHPVKDKLLHRPGYTNNVSVEIDMKGSVFQFLPEKMMPTRAIDLDETHALLDTIRADAKKRGNFLPEPRPAQQVDFLMKQAGRERALADVAKKEQLMLREGYSPDEIKTLSEETKARIARKYEALTAVDQAIMAQFGFTTRVELDAYRRERERIEGLPGQRAAIDQYNRGAARASGETPGETPAQAAAAATRLNPPATPTIATELGMQAPYLAERGRRRAIPAGQAALAALAKPRDNLSSGSEATGVPSAGFVSRDAIRRTVGAQDGGATAPTEGDPAALTRKLRQQLTAMTPPQAILTGVRRKLRPARG